MSRLMQYGIAYLAAEVRTGKTLTALSVAAKGNKKEVLFVTKKKAMSSIDKDFKDGGFTYNLTLINYDSLHKIENRKFDFVIVDEAHSCGAFPKMSLRTERLQRIIQHTSVLLMSGTPNPETAVQLFHQFDLSYRSPWKDYRNFYHWANDGYVIKKTKYLYNREIADYSTPDWEMINRDVDKYMVRLSQIEAGFKQEVKEHKLYVKMDPKIYSLIEILKRDKVYEFMDGGDAILCDTAVKAMIKFRQIYSGTIKTENGVRKILDETKAKFIQEKFAGRKIAIFYCFIAEGDLLKKYFPNNTDNPEEFNNSVDKTFICQIVSGREGVSLRTAEALVMYNIDFSATSYFQARARMQFKDREADAELYWVMAEEGIEEKVLRVVAGKKKYTQKYFEKDFGLKFKNEKRITNTI